VDCKTIEGFRCWEFVKSPFWKALTACDYMHIMPPQGEMSCMIPHHLFYSIELRKEKRTDYGDLQLPTPRHCLLEDEIPKCVYLSLLGN